jgi:DNA-binding transcriptional MerR regulator
MIEQSAKVQLPPIPAKRYFTIGEVSELCGVKPHVLRYWEQEFTQLKPVKRRGNRRYYQHHEVLLIRRIRELLYEQGFTISGARHRLDDGDFNADHHSENHVNGKDPSNTSPPSNLELPLAAAQNNFDFAAVKSELRSILSLLRTDLRAS